jgi:outer membrane receptor for ferrienterochelin and colicins
LAASGKKKDVDMMLGFQKHVGREIDEDGDGLTDRVRFDNAGGLLKIRWKNLFGPDDQLTFFGRTSDESRAGGELATFANPFAASAENIKTERHEVILGYKKKLDEKNEISLNFGFTDHGRIATNDSFLGDYMDTHGGTVPPVDEMEPYIADENLYAVDLRFSHTTSNKTRLMAGAQYLRNELEESGKYVIVDPADPDYGLTYRSESKKHADEFGLYLQGVIPLVEKKLELVAGIRYDTHKSEDSFGGSGDAAPPGKIKLKYDEESFNPRLALLFKPQPEIAVRTSIGTGFRVPYGFSEDLHLCSGSPRVYKGAGLKPEESVSVNLGVDYTTKKYGFGINLFRTNLKDKIGFIDASPTAAALGYTYEWANIDDAYTQGVELSSKVRPIPKVTFNTYLTFTEAQYGNQREDWVTNHPEYASDSRWISRVPQMTGGINASYRPGKWDLSLGAHHSGRMYIDYCKDEDMADPKSKIKYTQGYWVVNAKVSYHVSNSTAFFAGVKNLFDRTQKERHPDDAAFMYAPYTGRIVYGGIEIKF